MTQHLRTALQEEAEALVTRVLARMRAEDARASQDGQNTVPTPYDAEIVRREVEVASKPYGHSLYARMELEKARAQREAYLRGMAAPQLAHGESAENIRRVNKLLEDLESWCIMTAHHHLLQRIKDELIARGLRAPEGEARS